MWFTDGTDDAAGRITSDGMVTEFNVPQITVPPAYPGGPTEESYVPTAITCGPDGALWLTSSASGAYTPVPISKIWRVSTTGTFTGFDAPLSDSGLNAITAGLDGALWFTGEGLELDRITTSGVLSRFHLPGNYDVLGGLALGPDGSFWITQQEDVLSQDGTTPNIIRVSPTGVMKSYTIPRGTTLDPALGVPVSPTSLTVGSDGAFWFTESNAIGRMTASGTVTQFPTSNSIAHARMITAGPGGNLWFVESTVTANSGFVDEIARMTTRGAITTFEIPAAPNRGRAAFPLLGGGGITSLTPGSDGNLWFTENLTDPITGANDSSGLGRITASGSITVFPLNSLSPGGAFQVGTSTLGPDGDIWFSATQVDTNGVDTGYIGRISSRGAIRLYYVPSGVSMFGPSGSLVAGPDGMIWYVTANGSISRISTSGRPGESIAVTVRGVLVSGPNHDVWFVGDDGSGSYNKISLATRSGVVVMHNLPDQLVGYYADQIGGMVSGRDGNLWFTDGKSALVRISGLETPAGGLDDRFRFRIAPDYDTLYNRWTNTTKNARPSFEGVARPGLKVTLWALRQGDSKYIAIGQAKADSFDGSWTITSTRSLADGTYSVIASQGGPRPSSTELYTLQLDQYGLQPNALVINSSYKPGPPVVVTVPVLTVPTTVNARETLG
jgi:streptogramin lyase